VSGAGRGAGGRWCWGITGGPAPRSTREASAGGRDDISEVQRAFEGPYMEYQDSSRKWSRYDGAVPEPRPGSVSAGDVRVWRGGAGG